MATMDAATVAALQEVQRSKQDELMSYRNVVGFGISTKITGGVDTGDPCLSVFVDQKLPPEELRSEERIPPVIGKVKTDVFATGVITAGAATLQGPAVAERGEEVGIEVLRGRVRPVEGGYSVAHYQVTAGTYATAVYDATAFPGIPRRYYLLSNNHVLANSNNASIGDPIVQPGPYDGGVVGRDTIARLARFVQIQFTGAPNYVDAALAEGQFDVLDREIYWIGYVRGSIAPSIGLIVQKTGRTTNYTTGRITAIHATVNVNYGGGRVARFVEQILTTNMSAPGDSGSLVLDLDNRAVGLLFAGSSTVTVLNDIRRVQLLLGICIS